MKILFTGASSFTGFWFVRSLVRAGHDVVCAATASTERYEGIRRQRVEQLRPLCRFVPNAPFGNDAFLELIHGHNWDLLCHHGAAGMARYRSSEFDADRALELNTLNIDRVLEALRGRGGKGVLLTGTTYEMNEGAGDEPPRAFSPYGRAKGLTYEFFRDRCARATVRLGKFVVPNPFGPFEEPRFTAYLMNSWKEGEVATVRTPDYIRDNIHVDLLALTYVKFAQRVADAHEPLLKINPSGYVESQGAFARRVAREVRARLAWDCALEFMKQTEFDEPRRRVNTEPAAAQAPEWDETRAWDGFTRFYSPT